MEKNETEEVTEVSENKIEDGFIDACEVKDAQEVQNKVEEARVNFAKVYNDVTKKNRILGIVAFVIMMALFVIGYVKPAIMFIMLIIVVVMFIGLFIYTRLSRKKMDAAVANYLGVYGSVTDSYVYKNEDITDVKLGFKVKPDEEDIRKMNFKEDVIQIGSRDTIEGKIDGYEFSTSDASIKTGILKERKTHKTCFVGKVIQFGINVEDKGRTLMYLKGCGDAEPTALSDVNEVSVEELSLQWKVYTSNDNYKKIFTSPLISALNHLSTDETMNDVIISITQDKFIIGLSYNDKMMIIPLNDPFDVSGIEHYKKDMEKVVEIAKAIDKNRYLK